MLPNNIHPELTTEDYFRELWGYIEIRFGHIALMSVLDNVTSQYRFNYQGWLREENNIWKVM